MAVTPLAAVLTASRPAPRMKTAASWLFVLPLFTEGVALNVVKIRLAGLAALAFATIASGRRLPPLAAGRINLTFVVLALIVIAYLALGSWPTGGAAVTADSSSDNNGGVGSLTLFGTMLSSGGGTLSAGSAGNGATDASAGGAGSAASATRGTRAGQPRLIRRRRRRGGRRDRFSERAW